MHRTHPARRLNRFVLVAGAAALLTLSGCATYTQQTADRDAAVRSGNLFAAVSQASRDTEKNKNGKDGILYQLEEGGILRAAAMADFAVPASLPPQPGATVAADAGAMPSAQLYFQRSIQAFDAAEVRINHYEEQAKVKLASEAGAILTNQANTPYRGRAYDKVMMNGYKALNYMALGDRDAVRVELNRALQRQRDAVAENSRRIEEAQETVAAARDGKTKDESGRNGSAYDVDKARADARTGPLLASVEAELDGKIKAYGDYVNPFVVFLDGLYFTANAENAADLERGRKSIERVAAMSPGNTYIREDLVAAEAAANGQLPSGVTYVFFETGSAPYRDQLRIDIPTLLVTSSVSYVGAAFPKLKFSDDYVPALMVTAADQQLTSSLLCSMDSVVAQDFKNEWPSIVTKTLISTATKAALDAVVQKQASDQFGVWGQLGAKLITAGMGAALNVADTRTWRSLPKEFQYVRLATPVDGQLTLAAGTATKTITLERADINLVYVKSFSTTAPLLVTQFPLKQ